MKKSKLLISIIIFCLSVQTVYAKEASSSPTLSDKIKERLQETVDEGIQTIKTEVAEKVTQEKKKAYLGTVTKVEDNNITLEYKDQSFSLTISDNTTIVSSQKGKTKVEANDFILAMGFLPQTDSPLDARRILILTAPQPSASKQLLSGKVEEIDGSKVRIDSKILVISKKLNLTIKGIENPSVEDLELQDYLFALVTLDKNGSVDQIKKVFVIPGKNNPAASAPTNAEASQSATSPSPSSKK